MSEEMTQTELMRRLTEKYMNRQAIFTMGMGAVEIGVMLAELTTCPESFGFMTTEQIEQIKNLGRTGTITGLQLSRDRLFVTMEWDEPDSDTERTMVDLIGGREPGPSRVLAVADNDGTAEKFIELGDYAE